MLLTGRGRGRGDWTLKTPNPMVQVPVLAGDIVLLFSNVSTQKNKWILKNSQKHLTKLLAKG